MSDDRYLEEISSDHREAFKQLSKKFKTSKFRQMEGARKYRLACLDAALLKIGVNYSAAIKFAVDQDDAERQIDLMLKTQKVAIENRTQETRPDLPGAEWGIYIYKDSELVYFISLIYNNQPNDYFEVTTNSVV